MKSEAVGLVKMNRGGFMAQENAGLRGERQGPAMSE